MVEDIELRISGSGRCMLGVLVRCRRRTYPRPCGSISPSCANASAFGQRVMVSGKPKYEGLVWQMAHPRVETLADDEDEPVGRTAARLSAHRGPAAVADAADRARGAGRLRRSCWTKSFRPTFSRPTTSGRCAEALPQIHFPGRRRQPGRPGGGWSTRSCSSCSWPWPCGVQQQAARPRPRRWRPRRPSTPASAGCSPSS